MLVVHADTHPSKCWSGEQFARVVEEIRTDLIATEGPSVPCIDIVFASTTSDWPAYARALPAAQDAFLARLRARR